MDIFWPDALREAPLAMFIHGGYWQSLDKSWVSHFARGLVSRGIAVAIPSHDLCPTVTMAEIIRQMQCAAGFLVRRHRCSLFSFGHSAGGHLTAMLLKTDWTAQGLAAHAVGGGVSISGLFDLCPLVGTSVNLKLGLDDTEAARLSPMRMPRPFQPLGLVVGGLEGQEYERQSVELAQRWGARCEIIQGEHHFSIVAPLASKASPLVEGLVTRILSMPR